MISKFLYMKDNFFEKEELQMSQSNTVRFPVEKYVKILTPAIVYRGIKLIN